jgi:hypothetical protein
VTPGDGPSGVPVSTAGHIETYPAFGSTLAFEESEMPPCSIGAPFAGIDFERSATPLDEGEAEVQRCPVERAQSTRRARFAGVDGLGRILVTTGQGRHGVV